MSEQQHFAATLVRGTSYLIFNPNGRDFHFTKGITILVDAEMKEKLEAEAVDTMPGERDEATGEVEVIAKAKFEFDDYDGAELPGTMLAPRAVEAAAPSRKRARAA